MSRANSGVERTNTRLSRAQSGIERSDTRMSRTNSRTEFAERSGTRLSRANSGVERSHTRMSRAQSGLERSNTRLSRANSRTEFAERSGTRLSGTYSRAGHLLERSKSRLAETIEKYGPCNGTERCKTRIFKRPKKAKTVSYTATKLKRKYRTINEILTIPTRI